LLVLRDLVQRLDGDLRRVLDAVGPDAGHGHVVLEAGGVQNVML
jgi:hypothetical protein